jgi:hypothetical protein
VDAAALGLWLKFGGFEAEQPSFSLAQTAGCAASAHLPFTLE